QVDTIRADPAAGLRLTIGSDTSHTYLVQDAGRRKIMTYVEIITEAPEGYLIIGRNVRPDGQTFSVDSLIVAQGSLAPLRHSDRSPASRMDVRYEGGRLRGTNDSAGTSRQVDDA